MHNLFDHHRCHLKFCSSCELANLIDNLGADRRTAVKPTAFYKQLAPASADRPQRGAADTQRPQELSTCALGPGVYKGQQCDAHDLLVGLLDHAESTKCPVYGPALYDLFKGVECSTMRCVCSHESPTDKPFTTLQLEVKESIDAALTSYLAAETMDGDNQYHCSGCDAKCDATKQLSIKSLSSVVVLQLKRFNNTQAKVEDHVEFTEQQDIAGRQCRLRAIIEHPSGSKGASPASLEAGHYWAYVRLGECWFKYNDAEVERVEWTQVEKAQAYMLFYELDSAEDMVRATLHQRLRSPSTHHLVSLTALSIPYAGARR